MGMIPTARWRLTLLHTTFSLFCFLLLAANAKSRRVIASSHNWGPWSDWSSCSSTCGEGVVGRERVCRISKRVVLQNFRSRQVYCRGNSSQNKVCHLQDCANNETDYRSQECSKHNSQYFGGRTYIWKPFINTHNKCELACRAEYYNFYAQFAEQVPDGTLCEPDSEEFVCIKGKCQKIGCDGIVQSGKELDHCGVCGGNNDSCRIISGIFTRQHLQYGYNAITHIPIGACHINITEMARSRNYLVLKYPNGTYILNGNEVRSSRGDYPGPGTTISYDRHRDRKCPGGCIVARGPTTVVMDVEVLYYHKNPGIIYHFTVPVSTVDKTLESVVPASSTSTLSNKKHGRQHSKLRQHNNSREKTSMDVTIPASSDNTWPFKTYDRRFNQQKNQATSQNSSLEISQSPTYISAVNTQNSREQELNYKKLNVRSGYRVFPSHANNYQNTPRSYSDLVRQSAGSGYSRRYYDTNGRRIYQGTNQNELGYAQNGGHSNVDDPDQSLFNDNSFLPRYKNKRRYINKAISSSSSSAALTDSMKYFWRIAGFNECSLSCGGGTQETNIVCMKKNTNVIVTEENCDTSKKPQKQTVTCNPTPCSADWDIGEWSVCSVTCGQGIETRTVECKQRISSTVHVAVSASFCANKNRPKSARGCKNVPCADWRVEKWTQCSSDCGRGQQTREVVCLDTSNNQVDEEECEGIEPESEQICDMGSCAKGWFHTQWSKQCSSDCGEGHYTRQVYCSAEDSAPLPETKCPANLKPRSKKTCRNRKPCGGFWFIAPWTECTSTCGSGVRKRDIVCLKRLGNDLFAVVGEENCLNEEKPVSEESCGNLPACPAEWFMSSWTECSASCGTGTKTREIKCLDPELNPSTSCDSLIRPSHRHTCNVHPCDRPQLDEDPKCKDHEKYCKYAAQARLCQYKYYRTNCCQSCAEHDHNHGH